MRTSADRRRCTGRPTNLLSPPGIGFTVLLSVGLVTYSFVVSLFAPSWLRFVGNVALATALFLFRRVLGLSTREIGISTDAAKRGIAIGFALSAVLVMVVVGAALEFPEQASRFANDEQVPYSLSSLRVEVLGRIPFETAIAEELLFRGIVYVLWTKKAGLWVATAASSLAYSLWHVGPTLSGRDEPLALEGMVLDLWLPLVVTLVLGVVYVGLRNWTAGVVGPTIVHAVQNGSLMVAGYITVHGAF